MMMIRRADDRGVGRTSWLDSRHTFSFANYYDPQQVGFSDLLVVNDDRLIPRGGFGTHSHRDMEIISYVLEGTLEHKDSLGYGTLNRHGDVQVMTAGTGIHHSEFNASDWELLHFLQIWIVPEKKGLTPTYIQRQFPESEKRGKFRLLVSPDGQDDSLVIRQDARLYAGLFTGAESCEFTLTQERYAYVHVARGRIVLNGRNLKEGDGARIREEQALLFDGGEDAEVLLFDLRPVETEYR